MSHYMCDSYEKRGHTLDTYIHAAKEMDDNTTFVKLKFEEVSILHLVAKSDTRLKYKELMPGNVFQMVGNGVLALADDVMVNAEKIINNIPGMFEEITTENTTALRFQSYSKSDFYFLGNTVYKTLGAKITDISGSFLRSNSIERDIALAAVLDLNTFTCEGLIRSCGNVKKIMAVYSERFCRVPVTLFGETVKEFQKKYPDKKVEVRYWDMGNKEVNLYIEFPDFIKELGTKTLIPGIKLTTSDTSYRQTVVSACWRNVNGKAENHYIQCEFSKKHSTPVTMEHLFELMEQAVEAQKNFYKKYADYRMKLRRVPVNGVRAFKKAVKELVNTADYKKLIGPELQKYLVNSLCEECNKKQQYTKDEILDVIIQFPEKLYTENTPPSKKERLRKTLVSLIA